MMKWMAKTFAALVMLVTTWTSVGNAAKSLEEGYCSVGAIFSLNIPNAIYTVSDPTLATLYEKEDGTFGVRCIKPGDVYITAIAKLDGGLYKFTYLAHITGEDTGETQMSPRYEAGTTEFTHEVVRLVNEERAKVGACPLRMANDLQQAAGVRAQEIVRRFSHTRPDGSSCFTVLRGSSYRQVGENIAAGQQSPAAVVEGWMNSQGHRENILNPTFQEIGVGYYDGGSSTQYGKYWVQLFRR